MQRVADFSNRLRFGRIVAITRAPHKLVTSTNSENDFSKIRRERDYAINFGRQTDTPSSIISNLSFCTLVCSSSRMAGSKHRETDENSKTKSG